MMESYIYIKNSTMKKILGFLFVLGFMGCVGLNEAQSPVTVTETITKDSTGKEVHVITKTYANGNVQVVPQASINVVTSPFWYNGIYYPYITPRVVVPVRIGGGYRGGFRGRH